MVSNELAIMQAVLHDAWVEYNALDSNDAGRLALGVKVLDIAAKVLKAEQDTGKRGISPAEMLRIAESMLPHVQAVLDKYARDPVPAMRELAERLQNEYAEGADKQGADKQGADKQ